MNTESEHWAVYCMSPRRAWYVMTSEGWQREDAETMDATITDHDKIEAGERIVSILRDVGWVFGVRMEPIDLRGGAKSVTESGESRRLLDGTAPLSTVSDDAAYAALVNGETHL